MNENDFNFCQRCGFPNEVLAVDGSRVRLDICLAAVNRRLKHLQRQKSGKSFERQKSALPKLLSSFLLSLPVAKTLALESSSDILKFLIWEDKFGKTVVHDITCPELCQRQRRTCLCPKRLAAGTLDSLVGKIRAIFI